MVWRDLVNDLGAFKHETDVSNKYEFLKNLYKGTSMLSELYGEYGVRVSRGS